MQVSPYASVSARSSTRFQLRLTYILFQFISLHISYLVSILRCILWHVPQRVFCFVLLRIRIRTRQKFQTARLKWVRSAPKTPTEWGRWSGETREKGVVGVWRELAKVLGLAQSLDSNNKRGTRHEPSRAIKLLQQHSVERGEGGRREWLQSSIAAAQCTRIKKYQLFAALTSSHTHTHSQMICLMIK